MVLLELQFPGAEPAVLVDTSVQERVEGLVAEVAALHNLRRRLRRLVAAAAAGAEREAAAAREALDATRYAFGAASSECKEKAALLAATEGLAAALGGEAAAAAAAASSRDPDLDPARTALFFVRREMPPGAQLRDFLGRNEKTRALVRVGAAGGVPPARRVRADPEGEAARLAWLCRRQEQQRRLAEQADDGAEDGAAWANPAGLREELLSLRASRIALA